MKIRKLTLQDHQKVFDLFSSLIATQFPEYSLNIRKAIVNHPKYWNSNNFKKRLHNKDRFILGAFMTNTLVGLIDAEMPFGGVSFAVWLMVHPQHQRQGIGSALLKKWEKKMLTKGAHLLYLYSDKRNIPYYQKLGFTKAGLMKNSWFGTDDYVLTKLIQEPKEENFLR